MIQSLRSIINRAFADACAFAVLFGLMQMLSCFDVLKSGYGIYLVWGVLFFAGIVRGVLEQRFLKRIPPWIAGLEWGLIVFAGALLMCIPSPKTDPDTNYWTIFGAFFLIFIVPSFPLSVGGFFVGLETTARWPTSAK